MSEINQTERARLAWNFLTSVAASHDTCTYGELGEAIGIHHRAVRYALSLIQDYCSESEEKHPPLTILVINSSGRPGKGFIAHDLSDFDNGLERVWSHDWKSTPNPFEFAIDGTSWKSLVEDLTDDPDNSGDIYVKVKSRGIKQLLFRDALLKAYKSQCAFSGIQIYEVLEACHIIPWSLSSPQQRMDIRNGILLNSLHHKLFDKGFITINSDLQMLYDDVKYKPSKFEESLTSSLHKKSMFIPKLIKHRPLAENIEKHNMLIGWEI